MLRRQHRERGGWTNAAKGRTAPKPRGGDRRSGRIEALARPLMGAIEARPDITSAEPREGLIAEPGEGGAAVSHGLWKTIGWR